MAFPRQGLSQRAIARQLHLSRRWSIARCVRSLSRTRSPGKRGSQLTPIFPICASAGSKAAITGASSPEIEAQGFRGSASLVRQLLGRLAGTLDLARQPGVVAKNDRQLRRSTSAVAPASVLVVRDRPAATHRGPTGVARAYSARPMPTCRNSISWARSSCRWSSSDKHDGWTPGFSGSPEFFGRPPGICFRHQARLRRRQNRLVCSLESGAGRGSDYAPQIPEKADVRAGSLRAASLARPTQSLIQASHKVRMSHFSIVLYETQV